MDCRHAGGFSNISQGNHNEDIREDVKRFLELAERAMNRWDIEVCEKVSTKTGSACSCRLNLILLNGADRFRISLALP